jgi:hypothetical protein
MEVEGSRFQGIISNKKRLYDFSYDNEDEEESKLFLKNKKNDLPMFYEIEFSSDLENNINFTKIINETIESSIIKIEENIKKEEKQKLLDLLKIEEKDQTLNQDKNRKENKNLTTFKNIGNVKNINNNSNNTNNLKIFLKNKKLTSTKQDLLEKEVLFQSDD